MNPQIQRMSPLSATGSTGNPDISCFVGEGSEGVLADGEGAEGEREVEDAGESSSGWESGERFRLRTDDDDTKGRRSPFIGELSERDARLLVGENIA